DLQFLRPFQVKNAGFVFFLKYPAQAENRVIQGKRVDVELIIIKDASAISTREFPNVQIESELQVRRAKRNVQENAYSFGSKHAHRRFTAIKRKRTEQARGAVQVAAVKVSYKDRLGAAPLFA